MVCSMSFDGPLDNLSLTEAGRRTRKLKSQCVELLSHRFRDADGEVQVDTRCKNPKCGWTNPDGTVGCTDINALQFDHIGGKGSIQRKSGMMGDRLYFAIKKKPEEFQLLCANCNEIKSKGEKLGARLHKTRLSVSN